MTSFVGKYSCRYTAELDKLTLCQSVYDFANTFLPILALSRSMIDYYADLVNLYTVQRLQNLPKETAYLYMICYVHHRYEQVMNNITDGFVYYVDNYYKASQEHAKEMLAVTATPLEQHRTELGKLIGIFTNNNLAHRLKKSHSR